jgi:mannonate dehydratase
MTKITAIETIRTRVNGTWLFVKVLTDQPGLYGIGSASDHYRARTVQTAIETIAPMLIGRDASQIEDIWQSIYTSGYWRNDSVINTVQAGIDMALWDIKGKEAKMPVYQLLGGATRSAVMCYAHAAGDTLPELVDDVRRYVEEGYQVIRCQMGPYGGGGFIPGDKARLAKNNLWAQKNAFDDEAYLENIPKMFEHLRNELGFGPKLTHDVHEHLHPTNAVILAKLLEPYRLFFLEDLLSPEQVHWYRLVRQQCTTPQAMGELFINPHEWVPLITERLIDYVRVRVSKGGGITNCRKIAHLCEWFGVRTAWQEGGDNDPVNQMAAVHVDLSISSFGVQEENHFRPEEYDLFPGHALLEGGYLYANDNPGLGLDIDEAKAKALLDPARAAKSFYMAEDRRTDGSIVRP